MQQKTIAAIDLGTSKFSVAVARISGEDVEIEYYREHPAAGIRNSFVFNPKQASEKLKAAIGEAEEALHIKIRQAVVGLPRFSVHQKAASGTLPRSEPDEYISREEIETLKDLALSTYPLEDEKREVIYGAVAQSFSTEEEIQLVEDDVIGTISSSVTGNFKIFIGDRSRTGAIDKVFNDLSIAIARKYFLPDTTSSIVLSQEEKINGVALIEMGAGVTSVSIWHGGIMRYYAAIPFGGNTVTNDIRLECGISESLAENIKLAYGSCLPTRLASLSEKVLQIRYEDRPTKEVQVKYLAEIIAARTREIIDAILYEIQQSGMQDILRSGIVLTGGCANLTGLAGLVKDMSGYNVRLGYSRHLFSASGCGGVYATGATGAIGMILAAKNDSLQDCVEALKVPVPEKEEEEPEEEEPAADGNLFGINEIEVVPTGKEKEPKKKREPKNKRPKLIWDTLTDKLGSLYDFISKED
ncbi:MAG: cell division protein FtsA [Bacteroidales bacterium]|nr:cell division protein FtsA [Bacteroidales bacterium]